MFHFVSVVEDLKALGYDPDDRDLCWAVRDAPVNTFLRWFEPRQRRTFWHIPTIMQITFARLPGRLIATGFHSFRVWALIVLTPAQPVGICRGSRKQTLKTLYIHDLFKILLNENIFTIHPRDWFTPEVMSSTVWSIETVKTYFFHYTIFSISLNLNSILWFYEKA